MAQLHMKSRICGRRRPRGDNFAAGEELRISLGSPPARMWPYMPPARPGWRDDADCDRWGRARLSSTLPSKGNQRYMIIFGDKRWLDAPGSSFG